MSLPGRVEKGVVVFEGNSIPPDGTPVSVSDRSAPVIRVARHPKPVVLPIFDYGGPADIELTNDRIAEILDQEDASS